MKDITTERRRLESTLASLGDGEMRLPGVVGSLSVKDVLAHLSAWERLLLDWYQAGVRGLSANVQPVGMSRRAIDQLNEQIYQKYQGWTLDAVRMESQASFREILAMVAMIPEDDLFRKGRFGWTGKLTLADYMAGNTCNHYTWAANQIRKWVGEKR